MGLLHSARPSEWIKNLMAFAAIVFSGKVFEPEAVRNTLAVFWALCLAASATYLVNDVRDREADREHPRKRLRPIASGQVSTGLALITAFILVIAALLLASAVNPLACLTVAGYLVLTTAYSYILKHIVIVDVLALAAGFVLRVIAGAEAIQVEFSSWLILCTFLIALFLGFGKRRDELTLLEGSAGTHRPILLEYSPHFLDMMMAVVTAATVMSYVLYTMDAETVYRFHSRNIIYTTVFVIYGIFRYLYLIYMKSAAGNPVQVFYRDSPLALAILLWGASVFALRYFQW